MKHILFLLGFAFCFCSAIAQNPPQKINANYQFQSVGGDSSIRLPKSKASNPVLKDTGMIYYNKVDKKIHWTVDSANDTTILPAPPLESVQWGDLNNFRGDPSFLFDTAHSAVLMSSDELGKQGKLYSKSLSVQRLPDSSYQILQMYPTMQGDTAVTAPYGNFARGVDQTFTNPDGQRDATLFDCYNCQKKGVVLNPNEIEFERVMESHFFATGIEMYDQFTYTPALGSKIIRPIEYIQPFGVTTGNLFLGHFDQYEFQDESSHNITMSFRQDGHFRLIGKIPECTLGLTDSATGGGIFISVANSTNTGTTISSASDATHFAPTSMYWGLNVQGALNEAVWSIESAVNAGYNMSQDTTNYLVDPPLPIASFAYILPGLARDGQVIDIYAGGQVPSGSTVVTSFTVVPNSGFGQTLTSNVSFSAIPLISGTHYRFKFQALNSRWYYSN